MSIEVEQLSAKSGRELDRFGAMLAASRRHFSGTPVDQHRTQTHLRKAVPRSIGAHPIRSATSDLPICDVNGPPLPSPSPAIGGAQLQDAQGDVGADPAHDHAELVGVDRHPVARHARPARCHRARPSATSIDCVQTRGRITSTASEARRQRGGGGKGQRGLVGHLSLTIHSVAMSAPPRLEI